MTFQNLQYFVEAAEDLNFSVTAKRLFVSPQSISKHIGKIEEELGVSLFDRYPEMHLTYAGSIVLEKAQKILKIRMQMDEQLQSENHEAIQINVRCSPTRGETFYPSLVAWYQSNFPNVTITNKPYDNQEGVQSAEVRAELLNQMTQFCISAWQPIDDEGLCCMPIVEDRVLFAVPKELYRQKFGEDRSLLEHSNDGVSINVFSGIPFLTGESKKSTYTTTFLLQTLDGLLESHVKRVMNAPLETLMLLCEKNLGMTFLSELAAYNYINKRALNHLNNFYYFRASIRGVPLYMKLFLTSTEDIINANDATRAFPRAIMEAFQGISVQASKKVIIKDGCICCD